MSQNNICLGHTRGVLRFTCVYTASRVKTHVCCETDSRNKLLVRRSLGQTRESERKKLDLMASYGGLIAQFCGRQGPGVEEVQVKRRLRLAMLLMGEPNIEEALQNGETLGRPART